MTFTSEVLAYLSAHPLVGKAKRVNSGTAKGGRIRLAPKGWPDIDGYLRNGEALYVECKDVGDELSFEQIEFLDEAQRDGCQAIVAIRAKGEPTKQWSRRLRYQLTSTDPWRAWLTDKERARVSVVLEAGRQAKAKRVVKGRER